MHTVDQYTPIGLADLGSAGLLARVDTKYALPVGMLDDLLDACRGDYRALMMEDRRQFRYATQYFDTADFAFYRERATGRTPRRKVRVRRYLDIRHAFLEVKVRDNKGLTQKHRVQLDGDGDTDPSLHALDTFPSTVTGGFVARDMVAAAATSFTRMTLVRNDLAERVTLDVGVTFTREGRAVAFPGVAFVEVKQGARGWSPVAEQLRARRIRAVGLSKYCLALTALGRVPAAHQFRAALAHLHRLDERDASIALAV